MNAWFARVRNAFAPKAGPTPMPSGNIARKATALERALKASAPKPHAPPSLHRSIMQAVRAAEPPAAAPRGWSFLKWLPAPALVALALWIAWHPQRTRVSPAPPNPQSLAAASSALELGSQMAQSMPAALVAPLSAELESLSRDLDNTAQFLLASVP